MGMVLALLGIGLMLFVATAMILPSPLHRVVTTSVSGLQGRFVAGFRPPLDVPNPEKEDDDDDDYEDEEEDDDDVDEILVAYAEPQEAVKKHASIISGRSTQSQKSVSWLTGAKVSIKKTMSERSKESSTSSKVSVTPRKSKLHRASLFGQMATVVDLQDYHDYDIRDANVGFSVFDIFTNQGLLSYGLIRGVSLFSLHIETALQILASLSVCLCFFVVCFAPVVDSDWMNFIFVFELVLDGIFCLSLLLRFNITVLDVDVGYELMNRKTIASFRLTQPSFWSDAVSCLPCLFFLGLGEYTSYNLRYESVVNTISFFLPLLRAARGWRVAAIGDSHREMSIVHPIIVASLLRFGLLILVGGHVFGCVWFSVVWSQQAGRIMHFDFDYAENTTLPDFFDIYAKSSMVGMYMLLGFDLEGACGWENMLLCLAAPIGVLFNAYLLAEGLVEIQRRSVIASKHQERSAFVQQAMRSLGIPAQLQLRVMALNAYLHLHRSSMVNAQLFSGLPTNLNVEVKLFLYHSLVSTAHIFRQSHPTVIRLIVLELQDCAHLPGDYVVRFGEFGFEMFFVIKGRLGVLGGPNNEPLCYIDPGSYFGEVALLDHARRSATVRAETFCVLSKLSKDRFDPIVAQFPEQRDIIGHRIPNYARKSSQNQKMPSQRSVRSMQSDGSAPDSRRSSTLQIPSQRSIHSNPRGVIHEGNLFVGHEDEDEEDSFSRVASLAPIPSNEQLVSDEDEDASDDPADGCGESQAGINHVASNGSFIPSSQKFYNKRMTAPAPPRNISASCPLAVKKTKSDGTAMASSRRTSTSMAAEVLRLEPVGHAQKKGMKRASSLGKLNGSNSFSGWANATNGAPGNNTRSSQKGAAIDASCVPLSSFADTSVGAGSLGAFLPMGADIDSLKAMHKEAAKESRTCKDMSIISNLTNKIDLLDEELDSFEDRQEGMQENLQNEAMNIQNSLSMELSQLSARFDRTLVTTRKLLHDKGLRLPQTTTEVAV
eukprot:gnl/MRDRNA2_/MRDRNA2_35916_c0_seq1.p1 gnl/MRDRNA2_/MRDRNA2_35916_c0~~gnl/MRDRNA2_/MRDRNA2_35916_c0_seq1.p1  ORF type:complete len:996 (+),score=150.08 gnl/MRDRNA2_/MRDRNA2_35916_c0_seq1:121-3108(+)